MKKNGFTLVELLAVVSILSVLLLLVVPKIVNQLNNSKEEVNDTTKKVIYSATEKYMKDYNADPKDKYCILVSDLISEDYLSDSITDNNIGIDISKKSVEISYNENSGYEYELVDKCELCALVSDVDSSGTITIGDKYTCSVNETDTFNFYVLGIEGEGANQKVNLIMDRNICDDGTIPTSTNTCLYAWHAGVNNNNYGPDTAMTNLYNATKNWNNVPDMDLSGENAYEDENNKTDSTKGYTGITTNNGVATITGKNGATSATIGTTTEPLKARLPRENEVTSTEAGCHVWSSDADFGSCNYWLVENLYYNESEFNSYCTTCVTKYALNNGTGIIYGYWLLSSYPGYSFGARNVHYFGNVDYDFNDTSDANGRGLRPVITVPKAYLQNG